ncbi:MAG: DUF3060 domain-containing protein [Sphingomonas bacterium]
MKTHIAAHRLAGCIAAALVIPAPAFAQGTGTRNGASISGVDQSHTIDCKGRPANVSGSDNEITFVGDCPGLTVSGTGNEIRITLRPGAPIRVSGVDNDVTWRVNGQGRPRLSVTGVDNKVSPAR